MECFKCEVTWTSFGKRNKSGRELVVLSHWMGEEKKGGSKVLTKSWTEIQSREDRFAFEEIDGRVFIQEFGVQLSVEMFT